MPTSIRLPDNIEHLLDFWVRQTGRTKAFYIREMILEKIDDIEDYYLVADILALVRKGNETTFTAGEVRKDLGLDD
jgi:RHH-type transcriptional regulator, rel operon repressor / antitoxin RelB